MLRRWTLVFVPPEYADCSLDQTRSGTDVARGPDYLGAWWLVPGPTLNLSVPSQELAIRSQHGLVLDDDFPPLPGFVRSYTQADVAGQRIRWSWSQDPWPEVFRHHPELAEKLEAEVRDQGGISREFVFGHAEGDPAELFLLAMAWGFGLTTVHWPSQRRMLTSGEPLAAPPRTQPWLGSVEPQARRTASPHLPARSARESQPVDRPPHVVTIGACCHVAIQQGSGQLGITWRELRRQDRTESADVGLDWGTGVIRHQANNCFVNLGSP